MIQVECIKSIYNTGRLVVYRIQDSYRNIRNITKEQLDALILNNKVSFSKAFLIRDIVDKIDNSKPLRFESNCSISKNTRLKYQLMGYSITDITNDFILLESDTELVLISDKQIQLDTSCYDLFSNTNFTSIDFHNVDTSKVEYMTGMFEGCQSKLLDLSSFNTSNVKDMSYMFQDCQSKLLDLSSFNTSNVINMYGMFGGCQANSLDLSSFDTSNVIKMSMMFDFCKAK